MSNYTIESNIYPHPKNDNKPNVILVTVPQELPPERIVIVRTPIGVFRLQLPSTPKFGPGKKFYKELTPKFLEDQKNFEVKLIQELKERKWMRRVAAAAEMVRGELEKKKLNEQEQQEQQEKEFNDLLKGLDDEAINDLTKKSTEELTEAELADYEQLFGEESPQGTGKTKKKKKRKKKRKNKKVDLILQENYQDYLILLELL